jgi:prolyl oligopeptidase
MRKLALFFIPTIAILASCNSKTTNTSDHMIAPADTINTMPYPQTAKGNVVDDYFGTKVPDPYRWLENDTSAETKTWVVAENKVTDNYFAQIPYQDAIKKRLEVLWNYEKYSAPFQEGKYTYFYKNDGLQNQAVLYRQTSEGKPEVFLDPNQFSADATTSLAGIDFSKDGSLAAYQISEGAPIGVKSSS